MTMVGNTIHLAQEGQESKTTERRTYQIASNMRVILIQGDAMDFVEGEQLRISC